MLHCIVSICDRTRCFLGRSVAEAGADSVLALRWGRVGWRQGWLMVADQEEDTQFVDTWLRIPFPSAPRSCEAFRVVRTPSLYHSL